MFNYYKKSNFRLRIKEIVIKKNSSPVHNLNLEFLYNLENIRDTQQKDFYINQINNLITKEWGKFPEKFIEKHIIASRVIILAWHNNNLIAFTAMSLKNLCNRLVHYIEFTVVKKEYQGLGLSEKLNFILLKGILINNLIFNKSFSINLMFISPNIKTIVSLAKCSSFIYPNPLLYDNKLKSMPEADNLTWNMAQELIRKSEKPDRKIEREGCVLNGSYRDTPWLIYNLAENLTIPKHYDNFFNDFAENYLKYKERSGKEFIIRAKIGFIDVIKFLLNRSKK